MTNKLNNVAVETVEETTVVETPVTEENKETVTEPAPETTAEMDSEPKDLEELIKAKEAEEAPVHHIFDDYDDIDDDPFDDADDEPNTLKQRISNIADDIKSGIKKFKIGRLVDDTAAAATFEELNERYAIIIDDMSEELKELDPEFVEYPEPTTREELGYIINAKKATVRMAVSCQNVITRKAFRQMRSESRAYKKAQFKAIREEAKTMRAKLKENGEGGLHGILDELRGVNNFQIDAFNFEKNAEA